MKKITSKIAVALFATLLFTGNTFGQCWSKSTSFSGESMYSNKNIVENAAESERLSTLVAAVKAADLVETLQGSGPFTVLAPTNDAFENLPSGTVETLLKPENKGALSNVLTYHVIAGKFSSDDIAKLIKAGHGKAVVKTVSGGELTFMMNGSRNILVKDENGRTANISIYDVDQSNGVVHVIDAVVLPKA